MWLSPQRRGHSCYKIAKVSWVPMIDVPETEWRCGKIQDRQYATVRFIRGVGIPKPMFWHASNSSNGCLRTRQ
eukprot:8030442-Pyramimonas_sp.AAC.1